MTRKQWTLIALAVVLGGFSLYLNRDWFAGDNIQIMHRSRPMRGFTGRRNRPDPNPIDPVFFGFDRKVKLTSVRVISVDELQTNKFPHALWNLVSDSNSVPTRGFFYGTPLPGMRPSFKGAQPEPLLPKTKYRLEIEAGAQKAEHDFEPVPKTS